MKDDMSIKVLSLVAGGLLVGGVFGGITYFINPGSAGVTFVIFSFIGFVFLCILSGGPCMVFCGKCGEQIMDRSYWECERCGGCYCGRCFMKHWEDCKNEV